MKKKKTKLRKRRYTKNKEKPHFRPGRGSRRKYLRKKKKKKLLRLRNYTALRIIALKQEIKNHSSHRCHSIVSNFGRYIYIPFLNNLSSASFKIRNSKR